MNKKGFTLVELLVSISILSIVIVFMSSLVLKLKDQIFENNIDVNMMIVQSSASKTINYDTARYGIKEVDCENINKCNITFKNDMVRTIEIINDGQTLKYYDSNKVYFVRTLKNKTFSKITYTLDNNLTYDNFHKLTIELTNNTDYNIEIYGYWHLGATLTINPNGGTYNGTTSNSSISCIIGETITIDNPTRSGYYLDSNPWEYDSSLITVEKSGSKTIITILSSNATIKAKWKAYPVLTINPNGGTYNGTTSNTLLVLADGATQLLNTHPTRSSYFFTGWTVTPESGPSITYDYNTAKATITMGTGDATITANWITTTAGTFSKSLTTGKFTYTVPASGYYRMKVVGARGGDNCPNFGDHTYVGYGASAEAIIYIDKAETQYLYSYAGGTGGSSSGGANGGGNGYSGSGGGAGGGGASHIATATGTNGYLSELSATKDSVLIVGGGGAGTGSNSTSTYGNIDNYPRASGGNPYGKPGYNNNEAVALGGTWTTSTATAGNKGTFGQGASASWGTVSGPGGGGGYYGGNVNTYCAGGGSSYIIKDHDKKPTIEVATPYVSDANGTTSGGSIYIQYIRP